MDKRRLGFLCFVLRDARGVDVSNGGISAWAKQVVVIGKGLPHMFAEADDCPAVELVEDRSGYRKAVPCALKDAGVWSMFGGAFVWTSDSRFPNDYPIPLHDRVEGDKR